MTGSGLAIVDNVKMGYAVEVTPGTTPAVAFQTMRPKTQSLDAQFKYTQSQEFRSDRQVVDNIQVDASPGGSIGGEVSYGTWDDFLLGAVAQASWNQIAAFSNVSVASTSTFGVASGGTAVKANHLVKGSGFTNSGNNNTLFTVASSTATVITVSGTPLTTEGAAATKTLRVWGFVGATGDITATGSGLGSTTLDFTTLGLTVGQWIKPVNFATAALNTYIRITAIAAHAITCDNLPSGWTTDAGTGVAVQVQTSDFIRNGVTPQSYTIERWHTDTSPQQYFQFKGFYVDKTTLTLTPGSIFEVGFDLKGLTATEGASSASTGAYVAATTTSVMNAVSGVAKVQEGGSATGYLKKFAVMLMNTTREQKAVGTLGNVGIGQGRYAVQASFEAYFANGTLYQKYLNATLTSFAVAVKDASSNAYVVTMPAARVTSAKVTAGSINQDVTLQITADGQIDTLTGCMVQIDRFPA